MGGLFQGENAGRLLAGLGQGAAAWLQNREQSKQAERNRAAELNLLRERDQQRIAEERRQEDRYRGMPQMAAAPDSGQGRQTPGERYARTNEAKPRYVYDPAQGRIVMAT